MKFALVAAVAAVQLSAFADISYTIKNYVPDGLIIQYDAIDNEGTGVHNGEAAVWKNLGSLGSLYDCTLSANGSWSEDGKALSCSGAGYAAEASNGRGPLYSTIEGAFIRVSDGTMVNAYSTYAKNERVLAFSGSTACFLSGDNAPAVTGVAANEYQQLAATYAGNMVAAVYKGGTKIDSPTVVKLNSVYATNNGLTLGSRRSSGLETRWTGKIHTVRFYERVLTDDELLFNANIDKIRFEGADPATLVWPDGVRYSPEKGIETRIKVTYDSTYGSVSANGEPLPSGSEVWLAVGDAQASLTLTATGLGSGSFVSWRRADGLAYSSDAILQVPQSAPLSLVAFFVDAGTFNAGSYVRSGLIVQYDAIDNEGTGTHNPEATVWKNLGLHGPQLDCTLSERGSWSADGKSFVCAGGGYAAAASAVAPAYHTVETCFNRNSSGTAIMMNATKSLNRYIAFSDSTLGFSWINNNTENLSTPNVAAKVDQQYAATYEGDSVVNIFKKGSRLADEDLKMTKFTNLFSCDYLTIGSRQTAANEHPWVGKIHTIRLYDRALTDDELLFNANIDRLRYEGVDLTTLTWPTNCRYENGQLEFFVKLAVNVTGVGTVEVTGGPAAEGAWMAAGSEIRLTPKPGTGKMFGGFVNRPYTSKMDGNDLVITVVNPFTDWQVGALFHDKWTYPLPKEGLVIDLDATRPDLMTMDDEGYVSAWRSVVGGVTFTNSAVDLPFYDASAAGGRGVVWFNCAKDKATKVANWLTADARTSTRTVIMVFNMYKFKTANGYTMWGGDSSFPCGDGVYLPYANTQKGFYYNGILQGAVSYLNAYPHEVSMSTGKQLDLVTTDNKDLFFEVEATDSYFASFCRDRPLYFGMKSAAYDRIVQMKEFIVYDRKLTKDEHDFINRTLREKWGTPYSDASDSTYPADLKNRVKVWTNAAGDDDWGDDANWLGGAPASNEVSVIEGANVKVKTKATFTGDAKFLEGASLDIAGGTVRLMEGTTTDLPATTTIGTGSSFYGGGAVRLGGDIETGDLTACWTTFDLNGCDLTVRSLVGGVVTNSAAEESVLTVKTEEGAPSELNASVLGNIAVVRGGDAGLELKVDGSLRNSRTVLGDGVTKLNDEDTLPLLDGCVMHLDASDLSTLKTNAEGRVLEWLSKHDGMTCFRTNEAHAADSTLLPVYDPTGLNGLGAVRFGYADDGATQTATFLKGDRKLRIMTFFFVLRQKDYKKYATPLASMTESNVLFSDNGWAHNAYSWKIIGTDTWINGERIYDAFVSPVYTNETAAANAVNYTNLGGVPGLMRYYEAPKFGATELLAARRKTAYIFPDDKGNGTYPSLGAMRRNNSTYLSRFFPGWISEVILYDRILDNEEFRRVQRYLQRKWNVIPLADPPCGASVLAADADLTLESGATLDLGVGGETQTVAQVTVTGPATVTNGVLRADAYVFGYGADGVLPALTVTSPLDLADATLAFEGPARKLEAGKFILAPGGLLGDFSSVDWGEATPSTVTTRGRFVRIGELGLLLFVQ